MSGSLVAHDSGEFVFSREGGDHFAGADRVIIHRLQSGMPFSAPTAELTKRRKDDWITGWLRPKQTLQPRMMISILSGLTPKVWARQAFASAIVSG